MLQTSALWAWRLPRGLEHASHVLGRALWHALALTDASPRAPQVCSTSREDKRTGFTVPPQTTRDLLGHPRERERLGEGTSSTRGEGGGGMEEQEEGCGQSQRAGLPQVMMMSIVLFQKQTELGSIYLEEGTDLGDTRQETQYRDLYTVSKRPFFYPALPFPILPCAPHLPPLFSSEDFSSEDKHAFLISLPSSTAPCSSVNADASAGTAGEPFAPASVVGTASGGVAAEEAAHTHTHTHTYTHTGRLLDELLRLLEGGIGLDEDSQTSVSV